MIDLPPIDVWSGAAHLVILTSLLINLLQIRRLTKKLNGHLEKHMEMSRE